MFKRNLVSNRQTVDLTSHLRKIHRDCSAFPLLIGLDQEGGLVARVPLDPPMPSPWAIGAARSPRLAEEIGYQVGRALFDLGFNMNLAPVLDLGDARKKSFIGSRSFGSDPEMVGQIGLSFSLGLIRSRVLPVAKHFPGIGSGLHDPHLTMVRRSVSSASLWQKDLMPFRDFAQLFPTGMMPSHLVYSAADDTKKSGTYSRVLLQDWLRDKLNFRGLIVSDDLLMKGAQAQPDLGQNVVAALWAGVDLVMVTWSRKNQSQAVHAVEAALKSGSLSSSVLLEKIERIRKIKRILQQPPRGLASGPQLLVPGSLRYTDLTYEVLRRNLRAQMMALSQSKPERIFIWPTSLRDKWQVERALHHKILDAGSPAFKKIGSRDLILAFVRTPKAAREIRKWASAAKEKTIVINQSGPGAIGPGFHAEIELFMEHPMLASEVAKIIKGRWDRPFISKSSDD